MAQRKCTKCGLLKGPSAFYRDAKNGHREVCKQCHKAYMRARRAKGEGVRIRDYQAQLHAKFDAEQLVRVEKRAAEAAEARADDRRVRRLLRKHRKEAKGKTGLPEAEPAGPWLEWRLGSTFPEVIR